jgi:hypothetical protein
MNRLKEIRKRINEEIKEIKKPLIDLENEYNKELTIKKRSVKENGKDNKTILCGGIDNYVVIDLKI